jgi:hypothetical protein
VIQGVANNLCGSYAPSQIVGGEIYLREIQEVEYPYPRDSLPALVAEDAVEFLYDRPAPQALDPQRAWTGRWFSTSHEHHLVESELGRFPPAARPAPLFETTAYTSFDPRVGDAVFAETVEYEKGNFRRGLMMRDEFTGAVIGFSKYGERRFDFETRSLLDRGWGTFVFYPGFCRESTARIKYAKVASMDLHRLVDQWIHDAVGDPTSIVTEYLLGEVCHTSDPRADGRPCEYRRHRCFGTAPLEPDEITSPCLMAVGGVNSATEADSTFRYTFKVDITGALDTASGRFRHRCFLSELGAPDVSTTTVMCRPFLRFVHALQAGRWPTLSRITSVAVVHSFMCMRGLYLARHEIVFYEFRKTGDECLAESCRGETTFAKLFAILPRARDLLETPDKFRALLSDLVHSPLVGEPEHWYPTEHLAPDSDRPLLPCFLGRATYVDAYFDGTAHLGGKTYLRPPFSGLYYPLSMVPDVNAALFEQFNTSPLIMVGPDPAAAAAYLALFPIEKHPQVKRMMNVPLEPQITALIERSMSCEGFLTYKYMERRRQKRHNALVDHPTEDTMFYWETCLEWLKLLDERDQPVMALVCAFQGATTPSPRPRSDLIDRWDSMVERNPWTPLETAQVARFYGFFWTPGVDIMHAVISSSSSRYFGLKGGASPVPENWELLVEEEKEPPPPDPDLPELQEVGDSDDDEPEPRARLQPVELEESGGGSESEEFSDPLPFVDVEQPDDPVIEEDDSDRIREDLADRVINNIAEGVLSDETYGSFANAAKRFNLLSGTTIFTKEGTKLFRNSGRIARKTYEKAFDKLTQMARTPASGKIKAYTAKPKDVDDALAEYKTQFDWHKLVRSACKYAPPLLHSVEAQVGVECEITRTFEELVPPPVSKEKALHLPLVEKDGDVYNIDFSVAQKQPYESKPRFVVAGTSQIFVRAVAHTFRVIKAAVVGKQITKKAAAAKKAALYDFYKTAVDTPLTSGSPLRAWSRVFLGATVSALTRVPAVDQLKRSGDGVAFSLAVHETVCRAMANARSTAKERDANQPMLVGPAGPDPPPPKPVIYLQLLWPTLSRYSGPLFPALGYNWVSKGAGPPKFKPGLKQVLTFASGDGNLVPYDEFVALMTRKGVSPPQTWLEKTYRAILRRQPGMFKVNPTSSAGPVYGNLPNSEVSDLATEVTDELLRRISARMKVDPSTVKKDKKIMHIIRLLGHFKEAKPKLETADADPNKPTRLIYSPSLNIALLMLLDNLESTPSVRNPSIMGVNLLGDLNFHGLFYTMQAEAQASKLGWSGRNMADNLWLMILNGKTVEISLFPLGKVRLKDVIFISIDGRNQESSVTKNDIILMFDAITKFFYTASDPAVAVNPALLEMVRLLIDQSMPFVGIFGLQREFSHMMASGDRFTSIGNDIKMGAPLAWAKLQEYSFAPPLIKGSQHDCWGGGGSTEGSVELDPLLLSLLEAFGILPKLSCCVGTPQKGLFEILAESAEPVPVDVLGFAAFPIWSDPYKGDGVREMCIIPALSPDRVAAALGSSKAEARAPHRKDPTVVRMETGLATLSKIYSLLISGGWVTPIGFQVLSSELQIQLRDLIGANFTTEQVIQTMATLQESLDDAGIGATPDAATMFKMLAGLIPPSFAELVGYAIGADALPMFHNSLVKPLTKKWGLDGLPLKMERESDFRPPISQEEKKEAVVAASDVVRRMLDPVKKPLREDKVQQAMQILSGLRSKHFTLAWPEESIPLTRVDAAFAAIRSLARTELFSGLRVREVVDAFKRMGAEKKYVDKLTYEFSEPSFSAAVQRSRLRNPAHLTRNLDALKTGKLLSRPKERKAVAREAEEEAPALQILKVGRSTFASVLPMSDEERRRARNAEALEHYSYRAHEAPDTPEPPEEDESDETELSDVGGDESDDNG